MTGETLFQPKTADFFVRASKEELIDLIHRQSEEGRRLHEAALKKDAEIEQTKKENDLLRALYEELRQKHLILEGQHILLKNKFFGKARSKPPIAAAARDKSKKKKKSKPVRKKPSERYPRRTAD